MAAAIPVSYYSDNYLREDHNGHISMLRVMTYNIKFCAARVKLKADYPNTGVLKLSAEQVEANIAGIASLVNRYIPDVLFLQEADIASDRSAWIDQVQALLDRTQLRYGVYAPVWKRKKSLFAPNEVLGGINSGSAILSTFPLLDPEIMPLPSEWLIGMQRNILQADILIGKQTVRLANLHACVGGLFAASKKRASLKEILKYADKNLSSKNSSISVLAGDLNNTPFTDNDIQLHGFPDAQKGLFRAKAADYRKTADLLKPLYNHSFLKPCISNPSGKEDCTCSLKEEYLWNRKLDYIFTSGQIIGAETIQAGCQSCPDTMSLSDHCPIIADIQV
jgi:endonuclease/exonuclease/phosphatase family metal-dependent hydrolase